MQSDRWLYALALSAVAAGITGLLVPLYLVRLGAGPAILGITAALSSFVGAPAAILAGRYADRTNHPRTILLIGLTIAALTAVLFPLLSNIPLIVAVNASFAFALAGVGPVITMLIVAGAPTTAWNDRIARLNTYQGYGGTLGLLIGTGWTTILTPLTSPALAQQTLFAFAAFLAILAVAIARTSLPATTTTTSIGPGTANRLVTTIATTNRRNRDATFLPGGTRIFWAIRSLTNTRVARFRATLPPSLIRYFIAGGLFFIGFGVFWAPLPVYLTGIGYSSSTIFSLYLLNNLASTVAFSTAGALSNRHNPSVLQGGALGVRGIAFLGVGTFAVLNLQSIYTVDSLAVVAGLLSVVGLTWAVIAVAGTNIVSRLAPPSRRGAILGGYAALSAIGGGIGSLLGGVLASYSFPFTFAVAGMFVAAGGAIVISAAITVTDDSPATEG